MKEIVSILGLIILSVVIGLNISLNMSNNFGIPSGGKYHFEIIGTFDNCELYYYSPRETNTDFPKYNGTISRCTNMK